MNEVSPNKKGYIRNTLTVGAVAAALATGYSLRGTTNVVAQQNAGTPITKAPVVETPATRDAAAMEGAFRDVAKTAAPAVVTIITEVKPSKTSLQRSPRMNLFGGNPFGGGGSPFGGGNGGQDPFEEFFRDFGFSPNSYQRSQMKAHFQQVQEARGGLGSGMIYRSDGLILTNAHVVRGASTVTVKVGDDRTFRNAKVLGIDERTDVAVVKINATDLPTVKLGDSSDVQVGDWAIAVGNPFGLSHTVTVGVISAKARELPDMNSRNPGDYLQTDASINPGNSGGPLLDIYGRVIGINNAIYSESGGNVGIGFAIPINTARTIADRLVKEGRIRRGYLGVSISDVADNAAAFGLDPNTKGVLVNSVDPDTPGARAGLQPGDVIQSFNGQTVLHSTELQRLVGDAPVNSNVELKVLRGGQTVTLNAHLDELKDEGTRVARGGGDEGNPGNDNAPGATTVLGLSLRPVTPQLAQRFGLKSTHGVVVVSISDNSPAAAAGIAVGDVIERVGVTPINSPTEVQTRVNAILNNRNNEDKSVALYVNHQGQRGYVTVQTDQ
jgi:serine protease Do